MHASRADERQPRKVHDDHPRVGRLDALQLSIDAIGSAEVKLAENRQIVCTSPSRAELILSAPSSISRSALDGPL